MAGTLEAATRQIFEHLDRKNIDPILDALANDAQSVDEISRRWLRGADAIGGYFREAFDLVDDIRSTLTDFRELVEGDVGFVTCWLEQDYVFKGDPTHVSAPTTLAFRREANAWKILLIHTVPLAPEDH